MTQIPNGTENTGDTPNRPTPSTGAERVPPVTPPGDPLGTPVPPAAAEPAGPPQTSGTTTGAPAPASAPAADRTHADPARTDAARDTGRTTASAGGKDRDEDRDTGRATTSSPGRDTGRTTPSSGGTDTAKGSGRPLFSQEEREKFDARIHQAVAGFVENPRQAVQEADATFDEVVAGLTHALTERSRLLRADRDGERSDAGTEDLRIALQQYRDLTERLVRL
ncbi:MULTISPECIES: hypothetical protein [unclassified Streptomyces]|uniref:hypothetical protein n=1 Tax=unclassified Streptomyces TaxID=2593676 RepID=UPI00344D7D43